MFHVKTTVASGVAFNGIRDLQVFRLSSLALYRY